MAATATSPVRTSASTRSYIWSNNPPVVKLLVNYSTSDKHSFAGHSSLATEANKMGRRIGYARVSTAGLNLDLQLTALRRAGVAVGSLYSDTISAKGAERKELAACLNAMRAGDTLIVWRLDRLGCSLPDLVRIVGELERKGADLESLSEKIETSSAAGKLVFPVFAALAEFERNLIRERTQAGLAAARARGRLGGRRPKLTPLQIKEIQRLMSDATIPVRQIAERYNVSRTTIYKVAPRRESEVVDAQPEKKKP